MRKVTHEVTILQLGVDLEHRPDLGLELLPGGPGGSERRRGILVDPVQPSRVGLLVVVEERDQDGLDDAAVSEPLAGGADDQIVGLVAEMVDEIHLRGGENIK